MFWQITLATVIVIVVDVVVSIVVNVEFANLVVARLGAIGAIFVLMELALEEER